LSALSVASPVAGLAVEVVLAWRFGVSVTTDAFRVVSLVILFGQQVLILAVLPNLIVPIFAQWRSRGAEERGWQLSFSLGLFFMIPSALLSGFLFFWPNALVDLLGPGLAGEGRSQALALTRWTGLAFLPMAWSGMSAGVLYAHRIFWLPNVGQIGANLALAGSILLLGKSLGPGSLIFGVLFGGIGSGLLHLVGLVVLMKRAAPFPKLRVDILDRELWHALSPAIPLMLNLLAVQWGIAVANRALSMLPTGTLATFGYAWKMGQLVILVPAALATVLFPRFSESYHLPEPKAFRTVATNALRMAVFLTVPLTILLFALRHPLALTLFGRGEFSSSAAAATADLFGVTVIGVPAAVLSLYIQKLLFAAHNVWLPAWVQILFTVAAAAYASPIAHRFGAHGIAMLFTLASWGAAVTLLAIIAAAKQVDVRQLGRLAAEVGLIAVAATWVGCSSAIMVFQLTGADDNPLSVVALGGMLGLTLFCGTSFLIGLPECRQLVQYLAWQTRQLPSKSRKVLDDE
jgi:putative peptidoglycan lipid II flippase